MILVLDETRERGPRMSLFVAEALSNLPVTVVEREASALEAIDLALAWGVVLCELDERSFDRTIRLLDDARLNLEWKAVICMGPAAQKVKDRLLALAHPPGAVFAYPAASTPLSLRAIGLVVYTKALSVRRFPRQAARATA